MKTYNTPSVCVTEIELQGIICASGGFGSVSGPSHPGAGHAPGRNF